MTDELLQLCPIQFVDGVNESAQPDDTNLLEIQGYTSVAIAYQPKFNFLLTGLQVLVEIPAGAEVVEPYAAVNMNYDGKPSGIILRECTVDMEAGKGRVWLPVNPSAPAVLIHANKYWLIIGAKGRPMALARAKEGTKSVLLTRNAWKWESPDIGAEWEVMIRFYGRILPIVG